MASLDLLAAGFSAILGVEVVPPERGAGLPKMSIHQLFHHTYIMRPLQTVDPGELFDVNIRTLTGKTIRVRVTADFSIAEVKAAIEVVEGIPGRQQRLMFNGKAIEDDQTVRSAGILPGATLFLLILMRGGGGEFQLDSSELSPEYNYDFSNKTDDGKSYKRGGFIYRRPYGWIRYAMKVVGRYSDDVWLGPNGIRTEETPGEWPVSYHGTHFASANSILKAGLKAGSRALYGKGVYSSPSLTMVERHYAQEFTYQGKSYKIAFQNRVNPDQPNGNLKIIPASETGAGADYWLSQKQDPDKGVFDVRPYGVLIRRM